MGRREKEIEKQQSFHLLNKDGISYWQVKDLQEMTWKRNLMRLTQLLILQKWCEHCSAMIGFEFLSELCKIHQSIIAVISSPRCSCLVHGIHACLMSVWVRLCCPAPGNIQVLHHMLLAGVFSLGAG